MWNSTTLKIKVIKPSEISEQMYHPTQAGIEKTII
jgi:hypothetical protein